jgi:probable HAF family extracellular repeat protein
VLDLGIIPGGSFNTYSKAIGGDGQTVVGEDTINQSGLTKHAFVWTETTGMVDIYWSVGGASSTTQNVSTDAQRSSVTHPTGRSFGRRAVAIGSMEPTRAFDPC